jgi:hypothetical protein
MDEDFEGAENSWSGAITTSSASFSHFLGRLGRGFEKATQTFNVPENSAAVTMEFDLYLIDSWDSPDDAFIVSVAGTNVSLGDMTADMSETLNGEVEGIIWSRSTKQSNMNLGFKPGVLDSSHLVQFSIPASKFPQGSLTMDFFALSSNDIEEQSAGIDNFKMAALTNCASRRRLSGTDSSMCNGVKQITSEDFESGTSQGWTSGLVGSDTSLGHFLGRMGQENPETTKTFAVPVDADKATISFAMYEFGNWDATDRVLVKVGSSEIDLGHFGRKNSHQSGSVAGIFWTRSNDDGHTDQVSISVPSAYFLSGHLTLGFSFVLSGDDMSIKSGGIDNVVITVKGVCEGQGFAVSSLNAAEPGLDGDDDDAGHHCRSEDFPCEDGDDMVYVCHYSVFKGYTTYCVKEADSDIVRFYPNDYCGPCVGGYGKMKQHAA